MCWGHDMHNDNDDWRHQDFRESEWKDWAVFTKKKKERKKYLLWFWAVFLIHYRLDVLHVFSTSESFEIYCPTCEWLLYRPSLKSSVYETIIVAVLPESSFLLINKIWRVPGRMPRYVSTDRETVTFWQSDRIVYNEQTCYVLYRHFISCGCIWPKYPLWYHERKQHS